MCLECGQCAEVCARALDLVTAWKELEVQVRRLVPDGGAVEKTFEEFAARVDARKEEVLKVALP